MQHDIDVHFSVISDLKEFSNQQLIEKIEYLQNIIIQFQDQRKSEKDFINASMLDTISELGNLSLEKKKVTKERETVELSALDILRSIGEINQEKEKVVKEKNIVENSAFDIATALGELSEDVQNIRTAKNKLENTYNEAHRSVQALTEEKNRLIQEKNKIEKIARKIAQSASKIQSEKNEKNEKTETQQQLSQLAGNIAVSANRIAINEGILNKQQQQLAETVKKAESSARALKNTIIRFLPQNSAYSILSGKNELTPEQVTVIYTEISDFKKNYDRPNLLTQIRQLRQLFEKQYTIIEKYSGWITFFSDHGYCVIFGQPHNHKNHYLEAAFCARELHAITKDSGFDMCIGMASGNAISGDTGILQRPQFGCIGQVNPDASAALSAALRNNLSIACSVSTNERLKFFFETKICSSLDFADYYAVNSLYTARENPFRVHKNSRLYLDYSDEWRYIETHRKEITGQIDIEAIEIKDGSAGQADAIAYYALSLAAASGEVVNRENLLASCLLFNAGKIFFKHALLVKDQLSHEEKKNFYNLPLYSFKTVEKIPRFREIKNIWIETKKQMKEISIREAAILKVASAYEGLAFPKIHKKTSPDPAQALLRLKKLLPASLTDKFIELASGK